MKNFLTFLLLWFLGTGSVAQAVNIAVIAPKSQDMARFGHDLVKGVRTAVALINQNGGILGEEINLIEIEDRCMDNAEISTAKLISTASSDKEKLSLVIGPYCSNAFEKVADLYANGKVIRVIPMPLTTEQENYSAKGLFKIGGNAEAEAVAFYSFYKNKFADKNLAMFYDQDLPQTVEVAEMVQKLFVKDGHENQIQMFEIGNMKDNYGEFAKKVVQKNQVVYLLGSTHEIAKAAQNLQEENEEIILFTDEYLATGYFFKEMGNFVEGVYLLSLQDLKAHPEFTEDLVQLRLSGNEPKGLGVYGYAAVNLWKEMVDRAESFDFDKVCSKGEKETYKLPWGNVQFLHGVASKSSGYQIYQVKNGEYTQVD